MTAIMVKRDHWAEFTQIARNQGLSVSALVRVMVAQTIRRERRRK
jgi:antitoxin component of RelBE/YafQ-DinJ toxin-antitoxin module